MRKLRLDLDELSVDSFETSREGGARGFYHCTYLGPTCEACVREG